MSVSVCMAVHNGELFLQEQLNSILLQLEPGDELVISDDDSRDSTLEIIRSNQDSRVCLLPPQKFDAPSRNFEYALGYCRNEVIFLADQDDIWHPQKIKIMVNELATADLVVCDCRLIDENGKLLRNSFFEENNSQNGMLRNFLRNSFVGCCMAFNSKVLKSILPFPPRISMHDQWIGLVAMKRFNVKFIPQTLVDHRRHGANYSSTGGKSTNSWNEKVTSRLRLAKALLQN